MDFLASDESEFEDQVKSWRGKLGEEVETSFNPEESKFFSTSALSESRKARLERNRKNREAASKAKPKPKPKASK